MKSPWRIFLIVFSVSYICITVMAILKLYYGGITDYMHQGKSFSTSYQGNILKESYTRYNNVITKQNNAKSYLNSSVFHMIEIWGKAAIGLYMWQHIMNGKLDTLGGSMVQYGEVTIDNIRFKFRTGPGIIQSTVPSDVKYLVLILNGRSQEKITAAKLWLDYVPMYKHLQKLAVILLGNEECNNDWIWPYMQSRGGKIGVVFLVYDSPMIDNIEFYQWPLGVAVYRGFPNILPEQVDLTSTRSYLCNFLGTVYENSSRQTLTRIITGSSFQDDCIIKGRQKWLPQETQETLNYYMNSILKSDLTLSPVGKNTECYRIYEAMSLGSVPVVEDIVTPGKCDSTSNSPLRFLKDYGAPIIFIKNWHDLLHLLQQESQLTLEEKVERRVAIAEWYKHFKSSVHNMFVRVIRETFFGV